VTLRGTIADVAPNVENDSIHFTATLENHSHPALRPSMRVDVLVVTDRRAQTLTVRQGSFVTGADRADAFVLSHGRARRVPVRFGLRGFHEIEVVSGLAEGDEVILSDMKDYEHLNEMEVR
jgi:HlyD family secretion protein